METTEALPPVEETTKASEPVTETTTDAPEGEEKPEAPVLTAEQQRIADLERENKKLKRGIDRKTRRLHEREREGLTNHPIGNNNQASADDSEPLTLTRAEIRQLIAREAETLAPTIATQKTEYERKQGVIQSLAKTWGQERFDEVASDLDEAFGGLQHRDGTIKAAIEAVFEADDPQRVIEWLADPENADEAERISGLSAVRAGREIAKLETTLKAKAEQDKPRVSKAPAPLEAIKSSGSTSKSVEHMTDKEFAAWRRKQIEQRNS